MKKCYYQWKKDHDGDELNEIEVSRNDSCSKRHTLYAGRDPVYGELICTSEGDVISLDLLEDADDSDLNSSLVSIKKIIYNPNTPWERIDEHDREYIDHAIHTWEL